MPQEKKRKHETECTLSYQVFENQIKNETLKEKPQIWFAFHGIGQSSESFKSFANQNNFKVYSFELFYHEKKNDINQTNLTKIRKTTLKDWLFLMEEFLEKEKIHFYQNSIHIIGFSLGVRPALQFVLNFSKLVSINEIILIAPETLAISDWYRLGTQTIFGKFLLTKLVSSAIFKKIITSISSFIFSKNAQKLIHCQVYTNMDSLTSAWLAYRSFEIYGKDWKQIYVLYKNKITIVASENDNFVSLKKMQNFVRKNSDDQGKFIKWIFSKSAHARLLKEFRL